jgi:hypothetical protein
LKLDFDTAAKGFGWIMLAALVVLLVVNALFMLASPRAWFNCLTGLVDRERSPRGNMEVVGALWKCGSHSGRMLHSSLFLRALQLTPAFGLTGKSV